MARTRLKKVAAALLGKATYDELKAFRAAYRQVKANPAPSHPRSCNVCGYHGQFWPFGAAARPDALCPRCKSLERHRMLALYLLEDATNRLDGEDILHFAPEAFIRPLTQRATRYVTADLMAPNVDLRVDITNLPFAAGSFGIVICNHVLEHIPDDGRALAEIHRVLRPGGRAILTVPIVWGWDRTYENPAITSPPDRDMHFGQWDHVRYYGRDFVDRIQAAQFEVSIFEAAHELHAEHALTRGDKVFIACKPGAMSTEIAVENAVPGRHMGNGTDPWHEKSGSRWSPAPTAGSDSRPAGSSPSGAMPSS